MRVTDHSILWQIQWSKLASDACRTVRVAPYAASMSAATQHSSAAAAPPSLLLTVHAVNAANVPESTSPCNTSEPQSDGIDLRNGRDVGAMSVSYGSRSRLDTMHYNHTPDSKPMNQLCDLSSWCPTW